MDPIVLLITGATLCTILACGLYKKFSQPSPMKRTSSLESNIAGFKQEAAHLNSAIEVFQELTSDYFVSMNENGFTELCSINSALTAAVDCLNKLQKNKDNAKVVDLIQYVQVVRGRGNPPSFLWEFMGDLLPQLNRWDDRLRQILIQITQSVHKSSNELKSIGRVRANRRKSTSLLLHEILSVIQK